MSSEAELRSPFEMQMHAVPKSASSWGIWSRWRFRNHILVFLASSKVSRLVLSRPRSTLSSPLFWPHRHDIALVKKVPNVLKGRGNIVQDAFHRLGCCPSFDTHIGEKKIKVCSSSCLDEHDRVCVLVCLREQLNGMMQQDQCSNAVQVPVQGRTK